jgi:hypothetical protein
MELMANMKCDCCGSEEPPHCIHEAPDALQRNVELQETHKRSRRDKTTRRAAAAKTYDGDSCKRNKGRHPDRHFCGKGALARVSVHET